MKIPARSLPIIDKENIKKDGSTEQLDRKSLKKIDPLQKSPNSAYKVFSVPVIPSFIESVIPSLDTITYDAGANVATTVINESEILVANKDSDLVLPFN